MKLYPWTRFAVLGPLHREYLLPVQGRPAFNVPGGEALYAAAAIAMWQPEDATVGLVARTGEDFPAAWVEDLARRGWRVEGVHRVAEIADSRRVRVYNARGQPMSSGWPHRFAERGIPYPKDLMDYEPSVVPPRSLHRPTPWTLRERDLPEWLSETRYAHFTPLDFVTHNLLPPLLRQRGVTTLSLDPGPMYMTAPFRPHVRDMVSPLTVFQPSEEELRTLFGGQWEDLWNMAEEVSHWGVPVVVIKRGSQGVWVYDGRGRRRWIVPAYQVGRFRDPTGAGSAFAGGFLVGWARTEDPLEAALYGVVAASVAVETCGALSLLETLPGLLEGRLHLLREVVHRV